VRVRQGGEPDLPTFYRLLAMTGDRQRFPVPSQRYFRDLLRIMAPPGHAKIFIAEFDGQPLSAGLMIAFGGVVSYKRGGWSGEQGHLHPNGLMHWEAMRWAKREGYRCYDFDGIELPPADGGFSSVSAFQVGYPAAVERIRADPQPHPARRVHLAHTPAGGIGAGAVGHQQDPDEMRSAR
jgi:lipid II:glycine glycyltransferase (peptidoglycan interpeptide bridge formation enzyme)